MYPSESSGLWDVQTSWRDDFEIQSARLTAEMTQRAVRDLQERIDKLSVVNYALWTLLQDRLGLTEAELVERVRVVDLLDGRMDGKIKQRKVAKCERCGRTMSKRHIRCMYCGAENLSIGAFEPVL